MATIPAGQKFLGIASSVDTTEKKSAQNNAKQEYYTIEDIAAATTQYAEATVSSAQLKTVGSAPFELLPAPGAGTYYQIKYAVEYTHATTAYTLSDDLAVIGTDSYSGSLIKNTLINDTRNTVVTGDLQNPIAITGTEPLHNAHYINEGISLTTWGGNDPTLGDGTLLFKFWYTIKTFGTEL